MTATLAEAVEAIADALHQRDLATARSRFDDELAAGTTAETLARQMAATVTLPPRMLVWGFELDIWANPYRDPGAYAWRCGGCRWTGSHFQDERAVQESGSVHVREKHHGRLSVVSYLDEAYWQSVDA